MSAVSERNSSIAPSTMLASTRSRSRLAASVAVISASRVASASAPLLRSSLSRSAAASLPARAARRSSDAWRLRSAVSSAASSALVGAVLGSTDRRDRRFTRRDLAGGDLLRCIEIFALTLFAAGRYNATEDDVDDSSRRADLSGLRGLARRRQALRNPRWRAVRDDGPDFGPPDRQRQPVHDPGCARESTQPWSRPLRAARRYLGGHH